MPRPCFVQIASQLMLSDKPIITWGGTTRAGIFRRISMSLDSDVIVDRRRIRRKLTFWRVAAAVVAIGALLTIGLIVTPGGRGTLATTGSIARVKIDGLIRSDSDRVEALER